VRVVGLIPAAGRGMRIAPLPMSKELYPVGFGKALDGRPRPRAVCEYLLERMAIAGTNEAFIILRPGKWDIPAYLGDGSAFGIRTAYLTVHTAYGVPFTLDQAFQFVGEHLVALGFPDILFWPENAYAPLIQRLRKSSADAVLGLFPTDEPGKVGVVDIDGRGCVRGIYEKSGRTDLPYMWAIAVWKPSFSKFLHQKVEDELRAIGRDRDGSKMPGGRSETPIGDVLHAAIGAGLQVEAEIFHEGRYIDIGTPENLYRAVLQEHGKV
jgi:glucose-1-phosphate thymidylyltransferase